MTQKFDYELPIPNEENETPDTIAFHDDSKDKSLGKHLLIILGVACLAVLLALIGLYAYDRLNEDPTAPAAIPSRPTAAENQEPESPTARAEVETMQALSPSDELSAIITDLENTNLENIDAELPAIESELE